MPPLKTVYGSENIWGNKYVYKILKNYPEVISISGHSHYSLKIYSTVRNKSVTHCVTNAASAHSPVYYAHSRILYLCSYFAMR